MAIDWTQLAHDTGSLDGPYESGGDGYAAAALERIVGADGIASAVQLIVDGGRGSELAMNVLRYLGSERAARLAYEAFRTSEGSRAQNAVWLIKHLALPCSLPWISELLRDENVSGFGVDLLDQLVYRDRVTAAEVEEVLAEAERSSNEKVRDTAAFVRHMLAGRAT